VFSGRCNSAEPLTGAVSCNHDRFPGYKTAFVICCTEANILLLPELIGNAQSSKWKFRSVGVLLKREARIMEKCKKKYK
jgi:hypothetical protein